MNIIAMAYIFLYEMLLCIREVVFIVILEIFNWRFG